MDYDRDAVRLPHLGWEVRSRLTQLSPAKTSHDEPALFS